MKNFFKWLVVSSQNPQEWSLTVKAFLGGVVTLITIVLGLSNVQLSANTDLNAIVNAVVAVLQVGAGLVSSVAFLWGLIRKIGITAMGTNPTKLL